VSKPSGANRVAPGLASGLCPPPHPVRGGPPNPQSPGQAERTARENFPVARLNARRGVEPCEKGGASLPPENRCDPGALR
jgi:hypothetical protein